MFDDVTDADSVIGVIQCASKKHADAGCFVAEDDRKVLFVDDPDSAPHADNVRYARPDDLAPGGRSYRDLLDEYNREQYTDNPWGLLPAWRLYARNEYGVLVRALGPANVFILSAGWGLVAAEYLLPNYDITLSSQARGQHGYKRRSPKDRGYRDFSMLPQQTSSHVLFFGGKDYVPLFCRLTANVRLRTVFFNSSVPPKGLTCGAEHYKTTTRTNWHYECVRAFADHVRELG